MKQHFESEYLPYLSVYKITSRTLDGMNTMTEDECLIIDGGNDELTRSCINRIVDNLNKLAEYNSANVTDNK